MDQQVVQNVRLNQIIGGENVRKTYDKEKIQGLAHSLNESGLREPVHLLPLGSDRYRLLTGGRRLRAARKAGWDSIPAIIERKELSKAEVLILQIIENVQREDLTSIEKAKAIDALMKESGMNATQVALKLGLADSTVSKLLALLSLPLDIQAQIEAGTLPATTAYQLTKLTSSNAQAELAAKVAKGELTREKVARAIKSAKTKHRPSRKARPMRVTAKLKDRESVSVTADALDLNCFVSILQRLLSEAQKALHAGLTLDALLKRVTCDVKAPGHHSVITGLKTTNSSSQMAN